MSDKIVRKQKIISRNINIQYVRPVSRVAILVDGGFYRKRASHFYGEKDPQQSADALMNYCYSHLRENDYIKSYLYRIFYYDCKPLDENIFHPFLQQAKSMKKDPQYNARCFFVWK